MLLRLREFRRARQLTLKQVGDHLNKSTATVSRYEHELIPITSTDLLKLADLYRVHVRDFWHEQDVIPSHTPP